MTTDSALPTILEAVLMAADEPLNLDRLLGLFPAEERPAKNAMLAAIHQLMEDYQTRAIELVEVASGYSIRVRQSFCPWVSKLWEERPARYSRALLETLALIAYRQPITRAEIEDIRGVAVSSTIIKTLMDRGWIKIVGHRDVPGKPSLLATTKAFLDHFSLKSLQELPPIESAFDLDSIGQQLAIDLGMTSPMSVTTKVKAVESKLYTQSE
jgi:segregation and condensation protein B